jgi:hypothetical protein
MKKNDNIKGQGFHTHPERINKSGRPKKYVTLLREQGYTMYEINCTIQVMLQMNLDELKDVWDNKNSTSLEKTIAAAIKKGIEKGSLYSIETLLTRVYGKPKETAELKLNNGYEITLHLGERTDYILQTNNNQLSSSNTGQQSEVHNNRSGYQDGQDSVTYHLDSGASNEPETEGK